MHTSEQPVIPDPWRVKLYTLPRGRRAACVKLLHGQAVRNQYRRGCREQLVQWLDGTRATLFAPGQWEFVLKKPVWDRQAHERIYEEERIAHELARAEQDILLR